MLSFYIAFFMSLSTLDLLAVIYLISHKLQNACFIKWCIWRKLQHFKEIEKEMIIQATGIHDTKELVIAAFVLSNNIKHKHVKYAYKICQSMT